MDLQSFEHGEQSRLVVFSLGGKGKVATLAPPRSKCTADSGKDRPFICTFLEEWLRGKKVLAELCLHASQNCRNALLDDVLGPLEESLVGSPQLCSDLVQVFALQMLPSLAEFLQSLSNQSHARSISLLGEIDHVGFPLLVGSALPTSALLDFEEGFPQQGLGNAGQRDALKPTRPTEQEQGQQQKEQNEE